MKNKKSRKALLSAGIFFGLAAVASVTFAAYVIIGDDNITQPDGITIPEVTVEDETRTLVASWSENDKTVSFDAEAGDVTGYVRLDGETPADLQLTMHLVVTASEHTTWDGGVNITATAKKTDDGGAIDAVTSNYIVLPGTDGVTNIDDTEFETSDDVTYTYDAVLEFKWGTMSDGKNPSVYLDSDQTVPTTYTASAAAAKTWLETFQKSINNTTVEFKAAFADAAVGE